MTIRRRELQLGSDRGGALVELAVSMPLLALVLVGTVDFARVFYVGQELTNAARAGAQYGAQSLATSGDVVAMEAAATASSPDIGTFSVVAEAVTCRCATDAGVFGAVQACTTDCTTGHRVATVTVTASSTFNLLASGFPGVPDNIALSRTATQRVPGVAD